MRSTLAALLLLLPCALGARPTDDRARAEALVRGTLKALTPPGAVAFTYTQSAQWLGHRSRPWQTWGRRTAGTFLLADNCSSFYQIDSTTGGTQSYSSFRFRCDTTLVYVGYGESEPAPLTLSDQSEFPYDVAPLTPVFLLREVLASDAANGFVRIAPGDVDTAVYRTGDGRIVSFAIDRHDEELRSVSVLYSHPMYGDVLKTVRFNDYALSEAGGFRYPSSIVESEFGIETSVVTVGVSEGGLNREQIEAMIPTDYRLTDDPAEPVEEITATRYNESIHLIDVRHAGLLSTVVEFEDFLLVADAPLTTRNGELILAEARKIAPGKPVRYFAFGHHHPHYLGGVRAFVHEGATIISPAMDTSYIRQVVSFPRTLEPDSLALDPRPLTFDVFDAEKVVTDGDLEMRIVHIGTMSKHADDYLIYYFPRYRLVIDAELAWIPHSGVLKPAGERAKGLYDAIVAKGLDVESIIQCWPSTGERVKTIATFDELKRSVEMVEESGK